MAFSTHFWRRGLLATATAVAMGLSVGMPAAQAGANNNNSRKLRAAVTAEGVFAHLHALQRIADRNDGTRVSGTTGYDQSVAYAQRVLGAAGYRVTRQAFTFQTFIPSAPSVLRRTAPGPDTDLTHTLMSYSGSADVTATASLPTGDQLGCLAEDFGPANAGTIVLVSRGECPFADKATHADAAGALGLVVYNNAEGEINGTLGNTFALDIPAVGITRELGADLVAQVPGLELRLGVDAFRGEATSYNLLAESRWGDPDNVVMAGAHLDSVAGGPGINDNGSGSAALLEIARQMAKVKTKNRVRFALWGAEESGLIGSTHYIATLPDVERQRIALYLNFDMVGSPNYVRFVYDGDNSAFPPGPGAAVAPPGSDAIEQLFHDYFAAQGLASAETAFSGRSDYGPFIADGVGIPSGGLFTGAEGVKTEEQAAVYGGTAGDPYDPCYHEPCDDITNVSVRAIDEMSDAMAHAIITYAFDTRSVNGRGRPTGPPGQHGTGTPGGGHDHDHDDR